MKHLMPILLALALLVSACGLLEPTPNPDIVSVVTQVAPTATKVAPPTTSPPTFVPVPSFTPAGNTASPASTAAIPTAEILPQSNKSKGGPIRIQFPAGGVAATVKGTVGESNTISYLLRALKDQRMTVQITSTNNLANFEIRGQQNGNPFKTMEDDSRTWTFILPSTQDYTITVGSIAGATDFDLTVTIVWP